MNFAQPQIRSCTLRSALSEARVVQDWHLRVQSDRHPDWVSARFWAHHPGRSRRGRDRAALQQGDRPPRGSHHPRADSRHERRGGQTGARSFLIPQTVVSESALRWRPGMPGAMPLIRTRSVCSDPESGSGAPVNNTIGTSGLYRFISSALVPRWSRVGGGR
jgi:hypothetical protein